MQTHSSIGWKTSPLRAFLPIFAVCAAAFFSTEAASGQGTNRYAKAANQLVVASTIEAVGEALVLAAAAGVSPARVREALLGGFAASRVLELHGQRMLEGNYVPGARAVLHRKDARIVSGLA